MIRVIEGRDTSVVEGESQVVLVLDDAELKRTVGANGFYMPIWGVLSASAGVISAIKKMVCRRTEDPDQGAVKVFDLTNGLSLADFNDMIAFKNLTGLDMPKYPVLGGYEIVLTLTLTGGGGAETVTLVTKGENQVRVGPNPFPPRVLPTGAPDPRPFASQFVRDLNLSGGPVAESGIFRP